MTLRARHLAMTRGWATIYGDTDSIMVMVGVPRSNMSREEIRAHQFQVGKEFGEEATKMYPPPNELEMEVIKSPFFLPGKKKKLYSAIEYEPEAKCFEEHGCVLLKGWVAKKRSHCNYSQHAGQAVINATRDGASDDAIFAIAKHHINAFNINAKTMDDVSDYVITCSLNASYKDDEAKAPTLARMVYSETGIAPTAGTRIPFVLIRNDKAKKQVEKLCTVSNFISSPSLTLDPDFYIARQLYKGMRQALTLPQHSKLLERVQNLTKSTVAKHMNVSRTLN